MCPHRRRPGSCPTPWIKRSGKEKRLITRAWSTTPTVDRNTCRSSIPSGWPKRRSIFRSEPSVTLMITPAPGASSIRGLARPHWGHGRPQMFKTEVINQIGPWKSLREVEWETLKWVDCYNNPSQVLLNRWRSPARPPRTHRTHPARTSRGGVLCKPEHTRYGRLAVEQINLR